MPFIPKRDSSTGSVAKDQHVDVRAVSGSVVYLNFMNNVFRRHFLLPSKKAEPTPADEKLGNRAYKRFSMLKWREAGITRSESRSLEKKYTRGAQFTTAIDLGVIAVDTAMAAIAEQLVTADGLSGGWPVNESHEVEVDFGVACVKMISYTVEDNGGISGARGVPSKKAKLLAVKKPNGSYDVSHITLSA